MENIPGSRKVKAKSLSRVRLFATPWTVAYQAPQSMGFFQARVLEWGAINMCAKPLWSKRTKRAHDTEPPRLRPRPFSL